MGEIILSADDDLMMFRLGIYSNQMGFRPGFSPMCYVWVGGGSLKSSRDMFLYSLLSEPLHNQDWCGLFCTENVVTKRQPANDIYDKDLMLWETKHFLGLY
jgi:hypothetical protein